MNVLPWILLGVSLLLVAVLAYLLRTKKPPKRLDVTAQDLLHDLTRNGTAVLRVEVIDPANLLLRSPRG